MEIAIHSLGEKGEQSPVPPWAGLGDALGMPEQLVGFLTERNLLLCQSPEQ